MSDVSSNASPPPRSGPLPIAVLLSGRGRTLGNLIDKIRDGKLDAEIRLVVSSDPAAAGLELAQNAALATLVADRSDYANDEAFANAIFGTCRRAQVELVVMAGFIKYVPIPAEFTNRVVNIHPALIPAFCGKGFYGHKVHRAVLDYGAKISGCTVHFADNAYDHGPIILQRTVPVLADDTPETLAARVFAEESQAYPEAIQLLAQGRVQIEGRQVKIERGPT